MSRSIKVILTILIFFALCIPIVPTCFNQTEHSPMAATVNNITLTEKDNGGRVQVSLGSTITIRLEAIPGTGYSWYIKENNEKVLSPLGEPEFEESTDKKRLGGIEHQIFRFKAVSHGANVLTLHYIRKWEKEKPPEKVYHITIEID